MGRKKVEAEKKIEITYPKLILGLDVSTACIGISLVYFDGVNEPEIVKISHIVPKIKKKIKGIEALILRKEIFEKDFLNSVKDLGITDCVIEAPLIFAAGNSNPVTVAQLLQFNGLLSESVYRVLGIVPVHISSYDARMQSFPELISIRKFNKKGEIYKFKHVKKAIKDNNLVLFGSYPFDCVKKDIMMNMVCKKYPGINWILDKNGELKKESYDACDSLVCSLAYVNQLKHGEIDPKITNVEYIEEKSNKVTVNYSVEIWGEVYNKKLVVTKDEKRAKN